MISVSRHQKRVTIPRSWPIARKTSKWVAKANPGPHSAGESIPLLVVARDMLGLADNAREVKRILYEGGVLVDGKARKDMKFPVGIFDLVTIPAKSAQYRMLKDSKGHFRLSQVAQGSATKIVRIENKTVLKGGRLQLNLSDGTNILADGEYRTGDSLVLSLPDKKIQDVIKREQGSLAMIVGGSHTGQVGKINEIQIVRSSRPNRVIISGAEEFETVMDYVYVIGRDAPAIDMGVIG